jgi:hypothetical protein
MWAAFRAATSAWLTRLRKLLAGLKELTLETVFFIEHLLIRCGKILLVAQLHGPSVAIPR